ncbi:MAG: thiamine pyrophosphate-dependent enzyme [Pseudomonadota bacterium]
MTTNQITGRSAFLQLLQDEGITHLFGNPGTTELPIMHALKDHPDLTYVMGMQESVVVAMADGFSRASGRLVAANVHVAPGLGNAMGALYNAKFTGTPLILTAGQQEQGHGLTEPLLYDPLVPIAEPLVKWAVEVTRLEDLPRIVHRAAKIATTPPTGPVFLSLPGDILNAEAGIDLGAPSRIDARVRPADAVVETLAARLNAGRAPVILAGPEVVTADALAAAGDFAAALGAPVWQQTVPWGSHFLSEHWCFMGGLSRDQAQVRSVLEHHDLMVVLGADVLRMSVFSETDPMPDGMAVVQIGQNDHEMAKNYPAALAVRADLRETLQAVTPLLEARTERASPLAEKNWTAKRARLTGQIAERSQSTPIDPDWMTLKIAEALPKNAILVDEGLTATRHMKALHPMRERFDYHGLASGGIGWGVAGAVGVQLAHPGRPVVCVSGDGSAMYSLQAIWTAAHLKLPLAYVIVNNGGYRIIRQRLRAFHGNDDFTGMWFKDPELDFRALARAMGVAAERIEAPRDLAPALERAVEHQDGPYLIEVLTDPSL